MSAVEAFSDLYAFTGERVWLERAGATLKFINTYPCSADGGYLSHPVPASAVGVFAHEVLTVEENVALARAANQLHAYVGEKQCADITRHASRAPMPGRDKSISTQPVDAPASKPALPPRMRLLLSR